MDPTVKNDIKILLRKSIDPRNWIKGVVYFMKNLPEFGRLLVGFSTFFIILSIFLVGKSYLFLEKIPLLGRIFTALHPKLEAIVARPVVKVITRLESIRQFQVKQSYLIRIAFMSLQAKTSRTLVTIFGMAAGVGIIVYLLSLGYGIEKLVISQVASLDELQIIDVSASQNTALKINNDTIKKIKGLQDISEVHSLISLVGRIKYNKAQSDVLVYAADDAYFALTKPVIVRGSMLSDRGSGDGDLQDTQNKPLVAGATITRGEYMQPRDDEVFEINILPNVSAEVYESCSIESELLGYTSRFEAPLYGLRLWGSTYYPYSEGGKTGRDTKSSKDLGNWIYSKVPLFSKDGEDILRPVIGETGYHQWVYGCMKEVNVSVSDINTAQKIINKMGYGDVLGESTESAQTDSVASAGADIEGSDRLLAMLESNGVAATGEAALQFEANVISTDSAGIEYVSIEASQSAQTKQAEYLKFNKKPSGKAVISTGLMRMLGITEDKIVGMKFDMSFIMTKALLPSLEGRSFSEDQEYEVIGLISDDEQQYMYIPMSDIQLLGATNFSQLKLVIKDKNNLQKVRLEIETFGYNTASAADTVEQIESLFANIRVVLGSIGLVALAVASLGMFNTMTVSLLERTREIGGMKVIGMVSREIRDLFLAEAMIMGFSGGIGGLVLGYLLGQVTSMFISIFAIANGLGYLQLTRIPLPFTISIMILSFAVGILTGLYPAYRAKNISALNALRYE